MHSRPILALAFLTLASPAFSQVVDPGTPVAGVSQHDWAARWYQWNLPLGPSTNPMFQTDGAQAFRGDIHPNVFFLGGIFNGLVGTDTADRTIAVHRSKNLFFPIVNNYADNTNVPGQAPTSFTPTGMLTGDFGVDILKSFDNASLFLTLDGVPLITNGRQTWGDPGFIVTYTSPDNVNGAGGYDASLNTGIYPSDVLTAGDGWWTMLGPLPEGDHTLTFGGTVPLFDAAGGPLLDGDGNQVSFSQNITYRITSTSAPEPGSLALISLGVGALILRRRTSQG